MKHMFKRIFLGVMFVLLLFMTVQGALAYNVWKDGRQVCADCNERRSTTIVQPTYPSATYHGNYPFYTQPHQEQPRSPGVGPSYGTPWYTTPPNLRNYMHDIDTYKYPRTVNRYYAYGPSDNPYLYKSVDDRTTYHSFEDIMHDVSVPVWSYTI